MPASNDFVAYVHDQLHLLPRVTSRRMFGGMGLYSDGLFFALIAADTLYFKVDDSNRTDYVQRGARAFRPFADKPAMSYYEVPLEILEDVEELTRWASKSVAVALSAQALKAQRGRAAGQLKSSNSKVRPMMSKSNRKRR